MIPLHRHIMLDDIPSRYLEKVFYAISDGISVAYALNPKDIRECTDCLAVRTLEGERVLVYADSSTLSGGSYRLSLAEVIKDLPETKPFTAWGVELPPVGANVTIDTSHLDASGKEAVDLLSWLDGKDAFVVAHDSVFGMRVAAFRVKYSDQLYRYHSLSAECFKPLKTKREQDIEALVDHFEDQLFQNGGEKEKQNRLARYRCSAELAYDFIVSRIGNSGGESTSYGPYCGACHQNGNNPDMSKGRCNTCSRTGDQIIKDHGAIVYSQAVLDGVVGKNRPSPDQMQSGTWQGAQRISSKDGGES